MPSDQRIVYLNPRDLSPSRQNVRSDPGDLAGLAETIREHGILQPLGVTPEGNEYRVVFGNRRRDAAIVVGMDRVPCIVLDTPDDEDVVVQQVLENLQRLDLNDLEKSRAFQHLLSRLSEQGVSQGEALDRMARTLGLSARQIQRYLRLQQLGPEVQQLIAQGELGVTHAQHLVDLSPTARQEEVAMLVVEESLSAAELGRLCAALLQNANIDARSALEMLRRGQRVAVVVGRTREPLPAPAGAPVTEASEDLAWDDDASDGTDDDDAGNGAQPRRAIPPSERDEGDYAYGRMEPTTRDGNRVRKIHSLDAFMDELQRMSQCVQDGDLQRLMEEDEAAPIKLRLAARQLRFLQDAVNALVSASGSTSR